MRLLLTTFILLFSLMLKSQTDTLSPSVHARQAAAFDRYGQQSETWWDQFHQHKTMPPKRSGDHKLNRIVYGWLPSWVGTSYENFDYSLLTDIAYFSYSVNATTGSYHTINYWKTTRMVELAQAAGVRVHLTATLFGSHATFLENPNSRKTFTDSIISLLKARNANGVNIDFEGVPASQSENLTRFIKEFGGALHDQIPNSQISIALPAVDWTNVFDVAELNQVIDLFIIMGYEYYYKGASVAGPNSPKNSGTRWWAYNCTRSVNYYLDKGVPKEKLLLGVPYYGHDWPTADNSVPSSTTDIGGALFYNQIARSIDQQYRQWDDHASVPHYAYKTGEQWRQCWYDDAQSLEQKYDMVNLKDIGGIGIWALGYDDGYAELWNAIRNKFTHSGKTSCQGSFADMGGPFGFYENNEDWLYTIAPEDADSIVLLIKEFDLETDYDSLFIYDSDTAENLIGAYTGTNIPKQIVAHSGAVSLRFLSDGATTAPGFHLYWSCNGDFSFNAINEITQPIQVSLNPNPVKNLLKVQIRLPVYKDCEINILDLSGKVISSEKLNFGPQNSSQWINISTLPAGLYIIKISTDIQSTSKKIIVQ